MLREASFHEAGHCIVAWALGYAVNWAWVDGKNNGRMAYTLPRDARHQATILLAGTAAQRRACGHDSPLGVSDAKAIAALDPRFAASCQAAAEALVTRHWSLIEEVAARLLERGEVSDFEVEQACRRMQAAWCS